MQPAPRCPRPALTTSLALALAVVFAGALLAPACAPASGADPDGAAPTDNGACASCHPTQAAALAASRHGLASESAVFTALRARTDPAGQDFCDRCHAAHRETSGDLPLGVGCVTCHQAVGNHGVSNGRLAFDTGGTMYGPLADPAPNAAHASARSEFTVSADLCGTCHEVSAGGAFVETPYTEWSQSASAAAGVTCADCHMSSAPGDESAPRAQGTAAENGPTRALSSHEFVGPDDPRAPELLARAAALDVALVSAGTNGLEVEVRVHNRNPAHALPSGARFAREVWLEVSVIDAAGNAHVVSGGLDARGAPAAGDAMRVDLADEISLNGSYALPTVADTRVVRAVPAGQAAAYRYALPASVDGAAVRTVRARLLYRRYAFALLDALGMADTLPAPTDLADAQAAVTP